MTGADLAAAAAALEGVPFRLHGRDPARGLDCVGVVAAAFAVCGKTAREPRGYGLRNSSIRSYMDLARDAGFVEAVGPEAPGDVVLVRPGPGQHHLLVALGHHRFAHAHAGIRRVVIQPGPLPWPVERRWRIGNPEEV